MNKYSIVLAFVLFVFLLFIWQIPASQLQNWLIEAYRLDNQQAQKLQQILRPTSWLLLRIFVSLAAIALLLVWKYFQKSISSFAKTFLNDFQSLFKSFLNPFQNLSKKKKFAYSITFICLNGYTLYRLHTTIPHIDEAFSYVHFASKGFWVSALYYPNPNNHIFYNIITSFLDICINHKIWVMRLPSFLSFLLLQVLIFRFLWQNFSDTTAFLGAIFFALLSPVQAYSTMGRGYLLQMLLLWLAVHFLVKMIDGQARKTHQVYFVLFSCLAFYTIPTYLYYFVALWIAHNLKNFSKIFAIAKIHLAVVLLSGAVYLPVFLLNGKANVLSGSWQRFAAQEFEEKKYKYLAYFGDFWIGIESTYWIFWGILGAALLALLLKKPKNTKARVLITIPFWVLSMMYLQQKIIPERVWLALALSWVVWVVWASQVLGKYASLALSLLILGEIGGQFYQKNNPNNEGYTNFAEVYPSIPFRQGQKVYSNDLIYQNLLAFYNLQDKKGLTIDYSYKNKPYQWIILDKNTYKSPPQGYSLWKETSFVLIFSKP